MTVWYFSLDYSTHVLRTGFGVTVAFFMALSDGLNIRTVCHKFVIYLLWHLLFKSRTNNCEHCFSHKFYLWALNLFIFGNSISIRNRWENKIFCLLSLRSENSKLSCDMNCLLIYSGSKYCPLSHNWSVSPPLDSGIGGSSHRQNINEWVWLCFTKTLFIKIGGRNIWPLGNNLPVLNLDQQLVYCKDVLNRNQNFRRIINFRGFMTFPPFIFKWEN